MPFILGKSSVVVAFVKPDGKPNQWARDALWQSANSIPGVNAVIDSNGAEAALFGAEVSGQTYLYDKADQLVFQGGITAARGHWGDSAGKGAIREFLTEGLTKVTKTPVFGCSLMRAGRIPAEEPK
jgi:hypothetical protein